MPQARTIQVYKFEELSDRAKEKAREWFRDASHDDEWWDAVYEDAAECASILGIDVRCRRRDFRDGTVKHDGIAIYFSGFWSQGDGACFEGSYSYAKGSAKAIRAHAGTDTELHRIADELQALQRSEGYTLTASMKHRGHYSHSGCMEVTINDGRWREGKEWAAHDEALTQLMRDFADWIYRQLEKEWDWRNSDEQVDESIIANEYEFEENGERI